ncbi:MAG: DUF4491 family protein [Synergistaceae bacterium]|nr:DUF4491 family protein [Synergistaceae bacterium]MBQ9596489.1 DUF4491 family protein [Synergistaceae bacterium]
MNFSGIITGIVSFAIIGILHPVVIKCEYYFSSKIWPVFLVLGLASCAASLIIQNGLCSAILGVLGCCLLWCIKELNEQEQRVAKGWFPANPKRTKQS